MFPFVTVGVFNRATRVYGQMSLYVYDVSSNFVTFESCRWEIGSRNIRSAKVVSSDTD